MGLPLIDCCAIACRARGEWDRKKHGEQRRAWRKLHISGDPASSEIVAHELTDSDTSDAAMVGTLVAGSGGTERERHATEIAAHGRMAWQKDNDYGLRSLAETGVGRIKRLNGGLLRARTFGTQRKEVSVDISVLNRQIRAAKPVTVRVK